ncbi:hypothetical protein GH714_030581 [Hevea brasiliensis]|uniref:Retrotransposon gag domain-containing protein n=1 Tax=Hevea brasiliensis TaxID=3981 RepID=A0A6A6LDJ7_HEVBR|nr:hypothetical protein GH714_030581 [Hevea brasiliensis]
MMMELKAMVAGLSLQNNELIGNKGQSSNTPVGNRFNSPNPHSWHHSTNFEFPRFDGNDLETWLLKTEYYFEVVNVLLENRVKLVALHLEGKAILWHQGYVKIRGLVAYDNWQEYVGNLRAIVGKQGVDEGGDDEENMLDCEEELVTGQELQLSINAMRGKPGAHTMCVAGTCGKRSLQILIDTGSTHNFLDSHIARKVGCELVKGTGVLVEVANGQEL